MNLRRFKQNVSAHLRRAEHGDTYTVERHGKPIAQVSPPPGNAGPRTLRKAQLPWRDREPEKLSPRARALLDEVLAEEERQRR